jgi:hypothetical protein
MRTIVLILVALSALACGEKKAEQSATSGMQGMMMRSDSLMPMMRAHLDSLGALSPQFAAGMLSVHEAMASRTLDAMGADMTAMGMKPDPAWTALTDSIKRDLADLPALSGRVLDARLKAHIDRMRRLMAMHEGMMQRMTREQQRADSKLRTV